MLRRSEAAKPARAIERGGLAAANMSLRAAVEKRDEALRELAESKQEVKIAHALARENEAELQRERAKRIEAEEEREQAEGARERALARQREMEGEVGRLQLEKKRLRRLNLQLCKSGGISVNACNHDEDGTEGKEGSSSSSRSTRNCHHRHEEEEEEEAEELQVERFKVAERGCGQEDGGLFVCVHRV